MQVQATDSLLFVVAALPGLTARKYPSTHRKASPSLSMNTSPASFLQQGARHQQSACMAAVFGKIAMKGTLSIAQARPTSQHASRVWFAFVAALGCRYQGSTASATHMQEGSTQAPAQLSAETRGCMTAFATHVQKGSTQAPAHLGGSQRPENRAAR